MTSQTELVQASEASRLQVVAAADDAAQKFRDLNSSLTFELDYDAERDDRTSDCSDTIGQGPQFHQWIAKRRFYVEPAQATAPLADALAAELLASGWVTASTSDNPEQRIVWLSQDDVSAAVAGTTTAEPGRVSPISVTVSGPCIATPDGVDDGKPAAR